ncbi:MAG: hypothetical protein LBS60_10420 [Deltaproteobacteria bacterium]|nr:hypothetical protein [Deltaproteobacteria bacterium]
MLTLSLEPFKGDLPSWFYELSFIKGSPKAVLTAHYRPLWAVKSEWYMASLEDTIKSLARRILTLDEEELARLLPKYRKLMDNFTPSKEWEEAVIIYFMINGYRVKNAQFSEQLKVYMRGKGKNSGWAPPVRPDIREVLAKLTEKADLDNPDPPDAEPTSPNDEPTRPRPALRLVRTEKDS